MSEKLKKPNDPQCQSLLGYTAEVHERWRGICQLCGTYGASSVDFDLWRQLTVEHLIGEKRGDYYKQIKTTLGRRFSHLPIEDIEKMTKIIDRENTITACHFCNSTTSQHPTKSMTKLLNYTSGSPSQVVKVVLRELTKIKKEKKCEVKRKLEFIRNAFDEKIGIKLRNSRSRKK